MPIRCTILHPERFVVAQAKGDIVLQDIEVYFDEVVVSGAMPYHKLFDALDAVPRLSDADTMIVGARISAYAAFDPRGPLAVVADDKFRFQARRFLNLGSARRPAQIFETVASARDWLDAQPLIQRPPLVRSSAHAPPQAIGPAYDDGPQHRAGAGPVIYPGSQLAEGDARWPRSSLDLSSPGPNHPGRRPGHRNRR
jgi:hypothetical protein